MMADGISQPLSHTERDLSNRESQGRAGSQDLESSKSPKRPRLDQAQFSANVSPNAPYSPKQAHPKHENVGITSPSPRTPNGHTNMTRDQLKYSAAIMRTLKKHRDALPFLNPVDYVKMNIPDYPKIIKHPMDLNTVDRKLATCQYENVGDFIRDVRLVFLNCYKFNGPEAMISMLCQNVESAFEKSLRQMPPSFEPKLKSSGSTVTEGKAKQTKKQGTAQTSSPVGGQRRVSEDSRPKREIHPPRSKDYPEPITKRNARKNDLQMKFCGQTLRELCKSKYRNINYPFLAPVDVVALNIPDYPLIIKNPMDLSTIEQKLNDGEYDSPEDFEADIRLMFTNCYTYNPPATPVHKMGRELEKIFDDKWNQKPQPPPPQHEKILEDEFGEDIESDEEANDDDRRIALLERNIADISQQIASIKSSKRKRLDRAAPKGNRVAKQAPKEKKPVLDKRRRVSKPHSEELPEFTFEQKKDLSEKINNLTGDRLNTVVSIIQKSMPNLDGQGQDEIELDIDALDQRTLYRLHEFVTGKSLTQTKKPGPKKGRTHYRQEDADKKIRTLEQALQKFQHSQQGSGYHDTQNSSSDSDSDTSSGSDSDDSGSSSN